MQTSHDCDIVGDLQNVLLGKGGPVLAARDFLELGMLPVAGAFLHGCICSCDLLDGRRHDHKTGGGVLGVVDVNY